MPDELIQKHLPGAEVEEGAEPTSITALCELHAGDRSIEVGYVCSGDPKSAIERSAKSAGGGVKEIPGVGRGAYLRSYGPSTKTVTLFVADDDTDCWLSVSAPAEHDQAALARDLTAALTPDAL